MTEEHEERIIEIARRMVIWGESRDDVMHKLEVNGIAGTRASEIYAMVRKERISMIRGDSAKRAGSGLLCLLTGVGLFYWFWIELGGITRPVLIISALSSIFGLWRLIDGLVGYLCASSKEGSIATET